MLSAVQLLIIFCMVVYFLGLPLSKVKSILLMLYHYHCLQCQFVKMRLISSKNSQLQAHAVVINIYGNYFNTDQFFGPEFGFVLSKTICWHQVNCHVILNITSFSPCSSGMFEDSTYLYLIEPMDLTHSAVSLFLSYLLHLGKTVLKE